jgi:hypothetical protein
MLSGETLELPKLAVLEEHLKSFGHREEPK